MPRLFIAIALPPTIKEQLSGLKTELPGARWVKPEQMHLTLRFIGEVEETIVPHIEAALSTINALAFDLKLVGVGYFPPRRAPRVLWVGIPSQPLLQQLYTAIEANLGQVGLPAEHQPFSPHITIARLNNPPLNQIKQFVVANSDFQLPPFQVREFRLYRSTLTSQGALHAELASYPLQESDA